MGEVQPLYGQPERSLLLRRGALLLLIFVLSPIALFMLLIVSRSLGDPTPVTPDFSGIVGTWGNPDGARLVFHSDGTYVAHGMPFIGDGFNPPDDVLPANGEGTWMIDAWDGHGNGGGLELDSGKINIELTTTGNPARPNLYASIGDPDEGDEFTFTKLP